ncbi:MAG: ATPase [Bacteroidales bacterium]|nr:ATPase [Bacteroidales bacterium]
MDTPFVYGRLATEADFTDRQEETKHLSDNFTSLINTIIISPRRWGKSSLVNKAADVAMSRDPKLRVAQVDLFNVLDEQQFYKALSEAIIHATSTRWEEGVENAKRFLSQILPKLVLANEPGAEMSLEFDWNRAVENVDQILDLGEKITQDKGIKLVVCIDEFQNIGYFSNPLFFQKKLRAHWQRHQHVAYCLFGSKRHMMMEVFTKSSMPFYKFGDLMFLDKIGQADLQAFVEKRFQDTGKEILPSASKMVVDLVDCHPYYAQQLAQLSWLRTKDVCTDEIVAEAHASLVRQLSLLFTTLTQDLTQQQIRYLRALIEAPDSITSTATMAKQGITSATAAYRSKKALIEKDILDDIGGSTTFVDPIYAYWLRHTFFK